MGGFVPESYSAAFGISRGDRVLDVGCGSAPFALATHLADRSWTDNSERFGYPIPLDDRPFYECSVEALPFRPKEFDFVYCSHTLEHVRNPAAACSELMRVAKRGYIECPRSWVEYTCGSDDHRWLVDWECETLIFREKLPDENRDPICLRMRVLRAMHDRRFVEYWNSAHTRALRAVQLHWSGSFRFHVIPAVRRNAGARP
jgi:SAM-dependent methyltransferase